MKATERFARRPPRACRHRLVLPRFKRGIETSRAARKTTLTHSLNILDTTMRRCQMSCSGERERVTSGIIPVLCNRGSRSAQLAVGDVTVLRRMNVKSLRSGPCTLTVMSRLEKRRVSSRIRGGCRTCISRVGLPRGLKGRVRGCSSFFGRGIRGCLSGVAMGGGCTLGGNLCRSHIIGANGMTDGFVTRGARRVSVGHSRSVTSFISRGAHGH